MKLVLTVGDKPAIALACRNEDGSVVDLTGATLSARMVNEATGAVVLDDAAAVVATSAAEGLVQFDFPGTETDTPGTFALTIRATTAGKPRTFPAGDPLRIEILPR